MLTPKLKDYIPNPNGMAIGTVGKDLMPEFQRALGSVVIDDDRIKVFIDEPTAGQTFDNLRENGQISLVMVSMLSAESYQFKGQCTHWEKTTAADLDIFNQYMIGFNQMAVNVGFVNNGVYNYPHSSMTTLFMDVKHVFDQTPRTGSGQKII